MQSVLIISLSARAYAQAAYEAGLNVYVIDGFADRETQAVAQQLLTVPFDENGFLPKALLNALDSLPLSDCIGFLYGSGFDAQPDLLNEVALRLPLIGNPSFTLEKTKQPADFFSALATQGILFPDTYSEAEYQTTAQTQTKNTWLKKKIGGAGGAHIAKMPQEKYLLTHCLLSNTVDNRDYYQAHIDGQPASLLFLADDRGVKALSFNAQLLAPTVQMPFRYGGVVSHLRLSKNLKKQMLLAACSITQAYALKGLNSLDVVIKDGAVYVLEVNPRLSASLALHADKARLIGRHIAAFRSHLPSMQACSEELLSELPQSAVCQMVLYADLALAISGDFVWPAWAQDIPHNKDKPLIIQQGAPICTVFSEAKTASLAKKMTLQRAKLLQKQLNLFKMT